MNGEALANSLAGMSPEQAMGATQTAVQALQNRRQIDLQEQQIENTRQYQQGRLQLMQSQENRLRAQMQFESQAKKKALQLREMAEKSLAQLRQAQAGQAGAATQLAKLEYRKAKKQAGMIQNMNNTMLPVPGTDDKVSMGAAVMTGIFPEIVRSMASTGEGLGGEAFSSLPKEAKLMQYLDMRYPDMHDAEKMKYAFNLPTELDIAEKAMSKMFMLTQDQMDKVLVLSKQASQASDERRRELIDQAQGIIESAGKDKKSGTEFDPSDVTIDFGDMTSNPLE